MELHEYYVKEIFRKAGLPVLKGGVAYTSKEAQKVAQEIKTPPFWVKPQVLYGYSPDLKKDERLLPRLAHTPEEVFSLANEILGTKLKGFPVGTSATIQRIYIEQAVPQKSLCRCVFRVDFDHQTYTLTVVTDKKECTFYLKELKLTTEIEKSLLKELKINDPLIKKLFKNVIKKAYQLFVYYGAVAIELNPIIQNDRNLVVSDGRLIFDPDSLFRFPEVVKYQETKLGHEREDLAKKNAFRYMGLDGNIACLVNGIGLGWATIDLIKAYGGQAACLLDVGTEPTANAIAKAIRLALAEPNVDGILINIFGGLTDSKIIAQGILNAAGEIATGIPIVIRMAGSKSEEGTQLLNHSLSPFLVFHELPDAVKEVVKQVKESR